MDDLDQAREISDFYMEVALKRHRSYQRVVKSTGFCEECGVNIPQARINAINAVTCLTCAIEEEQRLKKYA